LGLINEQVPEANLETDVSALAKTIATRCAEVVEASDEMMRVLGEAVAVGPTTYEQLQRHS